MRARIACARRSARVRTNLGELFEPVTQFQKIGAPQQPVGRRIGIGGRDVEIRWVFVGDIGNRRSLDFETVYYVLSADYNKYMNIQHAINLRIFREFERLGIEFAYPTQKLYLTRARPALNDADPLSRAPAAAA